MTAEYRPQLATLAKEPPEGETWLHEIKVDGYRIGCRIRGARATLITRNGHDWTAAFPEIARAALALGAREALLDGEVVVLQPDGRTSFEALQHARTDRASRAGLAYVVFDLLHLDGRSLEGLPLEERKARLRPLVGRRKGGRIRYAGPTHRQR